ncbi:hypothetical protein ACQ4PT_043617 [Festuca glaucescens]
MAASEHLLGRPTGSSLGMVMASTGVAVMGSFAFGVAIGYSAPTEAGITQDLQLSLSQSAASLDFGRFCTGFGVGVFSYVAKVGRQKEFEIALQRLRGNNADVFLEAEEIKEFIESIESLPKAGIQDLFSRIPFRKPRNNLNGLYPGTNHSTWSSTDGQEWEKATIVGTFFFFAFVCAMAILFIVKIVPETKGKTLEEIQASINCRT